MSDPELEVEILPGVKYRIQSVDYGTFLERSESSIILRPKKDFKKNQQWTFIRFQDDDTNSVYYEIRNLVDSDSWSLINSKSGENPSGAVKDPILAKHSKYINPNEKYWKFILDDRSNSDDFYIMSEATSKLFAYVTSSTAPALNTEPSISKLEARKINLSDNYRWRLVEVTPASLPEGSSSDDGVIKHRFRTLNGRAIHSVIGENSLSIADKGTGDQREFVIVSKGNGKCTIYGVKQKRFLGVTKKRDQWAPTLGAVEYAWNIRRLNEITWSICADLKRDDYRHTPYTTFSLTVDNLTIILKPMKSSHDQLWLIEPADALPPDAPAAEAPNAHDPVSGGISDGNYVIRNSAAGTSWHAGNNPPMDNIICLTADLANKMMHVTHDDQKNVHFKSSHVPNWWAASDMTGSLSPVSWRLIPASPDSQRYYLTTDMYSLEPLVATNTTDSLGAFEKLQKDNKDQIWEFTPV